jgi:hypothetical protein
MLCGRDEFGFEAGLMDRRTVQVSKSLYFQNNVEIAQRA